MTAAPIWAAVIGGIVTLAIFLAGQATTSRREKAARKAAAASKARDAVQELLRAALDTKAALAIWETRWRDKRSIWVTMTRSFAQILAGYRDDRIYTGVADGLASAMAWRGASDAAEEAIVSGPMSRVGAAAAQIALLSDAELRAASTEVTNALGKFVSAYAEKPKSAARAKADKELNEAVGKLAKAARAFEGRPARPALPE
ncbi:hypothetical protein ACFRFU_48540 [Streptomyces sp. NPDC056704]|uniref:hypothetical protein n=1 Tax=Streptomyces sp. NPDC056704 TaxID=3345917 RepID=UPI0036C6A2D2